MVTMDALHLRIHELEDENAALMDALHARIHELEAENAALRKEREEIFYSWTKTDFLDMLFRRIRPERTYLAEKYWVAWKQAFEEYWQDHEVAEQMESILEETVEIVEGGDQFV